MPDFTIRRATADDADAFVENMWAVGAEGRWIGTEVPFDKEERAERFRAFVADLRTANLVAEVDGVVVGHLGLHPTPYGTLELGMTIVDGHRERGMGTALMEAGLEWARTTDAHKIELQVWPDNARAIALYEKFGFQREGYLTHHYRRRDGSLRDAIIMGLLL
ncbi:MAG TPA: GNAT family N-acetyltransferase [Acidimicrobiia bacterium]|nr:GNAT family N-acetyltransferase [Acidimicrobiia bacterium]